MPVTRHDSKTSHSISIFIEAMVLTVLPIVGIFIASFTIKNAWTYIYSIYTYVGIGTNLYFSVVIGLLACKKRGLYVFFDILNVILVLVAIVSGIVFTAKGEQGVMLISAMFVGTFAVYKMSEIGEDKGIVVLRYFVAPVWAATGLLVYFVIYPFLPFLFGPTQSVTLIIFSLASLISFIAFYKTKSLNYISDDDYTYEEETPEERDARLYAQDELKDGKEYSGLPHSKWKLSDMTINYAIRAANDYYNEIVKWVNEAIDDYNKNRMSVKSQQKFYDSYKGLIKEADRTRNNLIAFANSLKKVRFTSKDYRNYIVINFKTCRIERSAYHKDNTFKVDVRTFSRNLDCINYGFVNVEYAKCMTHEEYFELDSATWENG